MVYITGDTHADFSRFQGDFFPEQDEMSKNDIVIICGDFGGVWYKSAVENYWLNWLDNKSFTTVFVDGNHENFDRLLGPEFEVVDFHGGKAHKIRNSIYHLIRGNIYEFDGKKFFAFGGASSHDISDGIIDPSDYKSIDELRAKLEEMNNNLKFRYRVKGVSWWEQELPTVEEMAFGLQTLSNNGNEVDYIITHCLPQSIASVFSHGSYKPDVLTKYLDEINQTVQFKEWYCGHYHRNDRVMQDYNILYEQIRRLL